MAFGSWETAWDGNSGRPAGEINDDQLPCTMWQYRYWARHNVSLAAGGFSLIMGAMSGASTFVEIPFSFTHHVGKAYKEKVSFKWFSIAWPLIFAPGLVDWTMYYLSNSEKKWFYKWMRMSDYVDDPRYVLQAEQRFHFTYTLGSTATVEGTNVLVTSDLKGTASAQNLGENLLAGEQFVVSGAPAPFEYFNGSRITILSNDGFGKATCANFAAPNGGDYQLKDLPPNVVLTLDCQWAWYGIGDYNVTVPYYVSPYPYWYGDYEYDVWGQGFATVGDSYNSQQIYGTFTYDASLTMVWYYESQLQNIPLPKGTRIWLDQRNFGFPGLGDKGTYYEFRSVRSSSSLYAYPAKTCQSIFAVYPDTGGKVSLLRTYCDASGEWYSLYPLLNMSSATPALAQMDDGRWYLTLNNDSGDIYCWALESEFNDGKWYFVGHEKWFDLTTYRNLADCPTPTILANAAQFTFNHTGDWNGMVLTTHDGATNGTVYNFVPGNPPKLGAAVPYHGAAASVMHTADNRLVGVDGTNITESVSKDGGKTWGGQTTPTYLVEVLKGFSQRSDASYEPILYQEPSYGCFFGTRDTTVNNIGVNQTGVFFFQKKTATEATVSFVADSPQHQARCLKNRFTNRFYVIYWGDDSIPHVSRSDDGGITWTALELK